ncbi:hypothetical protein Tco_0857753 [Tanacetum coccineum]|uniref:Uncharacterized protein n=1 Tax=Tanacetum coccineum TaxID=301880 RepID=A0ABQ5BB22_9ASTR
MFSHEVSVSTEGLKNLKRIVKKKVSKERKPSIPLSKKRCQYICCQNPKRIADIEDDIKGQLLLNSGMSAPPSDYRTKAIESRALRSSKSLVRTLIHIEGVFSTTCGTSSILRVPTSYPCDIARQTSRKTMVFYYKDGILLEPIKTSSCYERPYKGVKASANPDIKYFFTSARDGYPLQDDVRLCLGDNLKKAQDHNQRQV